MAKKLEKKEKGFCGIKGLTEDLLTAAAEDLNESLGLNPAIDVEELEGEDLLEAVKVSMEEVYENDQLEEDTWKVMKLLGIEAQPTPDEEAPAKEEPKKAKKAKKAVEEPEADEDETPAPKAKKGKKVVEPEDDEDDEPEEKPVAKKGKKLAKAEEPEADDDDEAPAPKKAKAEKAAPKPKVAEGPKYSRSDAFGEALMAGKKNKKSLAQIVEDSDKLYSDATGRRSNPKEAAWCANLSLKAMAACGYVTVDGDAVEILVRP